MIKEGKSTNLLEVEHKITQHAGPADGGKLLQVYILTESWLSMHSGISTAIIELNKAIFNRQMIDPRKNAKIFENSTNKTF